FRAPGRINLIGEHTDYNEGFVLPAAIDFATYVAGAARNDRVIRVASLNFEHELEFDLDEAPREGEKTWARYVQGVALILEREGYRLRGADLLIDSDVPVGAGLSSSAALEISTAFALSTLAGHSVDGMELAKIGQTAEHEFAGVRSGIMDQFVSVYGEAGHALLLDCRSLEWSPIPVSHARFVICNTKAKHDLAESEYNKRRAECEEAAAFFGWRSLRDVTWDEFEARAADMPKVPRKRARHIITENGRVLNAVTALRSHDLPELGKLLNESHESLRRDFEVSSNELDLMAELARQQNGVLGARMMGGGFGGCTINLMGPGNHPYFAEKMSEHYYRVTGIVPDIYECELGRGVCEVSAVESMSS
ncbi:MAG TPA: galactokinase, partial [Pyrinomonadaceae bacterium]|nr:galactokinase [Pyrinomonadaceae bacterium]